MYIAIAGNIGSGKTTLTKMLSKHYGWKQYLEPVAENPYIDDYYKDISRWALNMEVFYLKQRFKNLLEIQHSKETVIQDRTIFEGVYVFATNNRKMGNMDQRDYDTYMELFESMMEVVEMPELMIYLRSSVPHLVKNIQKRGRDYEQMRAKALEGYFVRDAERNLVYCPQGEILRQKSIKRNGMIRYCNKLACKKCKCKCTIQKFKEADFNKDTLIKATEAKRKQLKEENKDKPKPPRMKVVKKVVRYVLHLDQNKMDNRKCLSEHPFGTMKRALGQYYFLLKGKLKVTAEMGLFCLSYNLRRAISLKGVPALIASLG
jgi:deoxyadenosine/deoxycytidine kinase